jgi:hypothetical protein
MTTQFYCQIWTNGDLANDADGLTPQAAFAAAVQDVELRGLTAMYLLQQIEKLKSNRYVGGYAHYFEQGSTLVRIVLETA